MTGPYPPPNRPDNDGWQGGDINSPFAASDPNSPFETSGEPSHRDPAEEPSPYEGVQYSLESTSPPVNRQPPPYSPASGPPMAQPHYQRPPMGPPQPIYPPQGGVPGPRNSGGASGLVIGGVIAGVVLLLVVAGIVVIVAVNSSSGDEPTGAGGYQAVSDLCETIDLSGVDAIASPSDGYEASDSTTESQEQAQCWALLGDYSGDDYGNFSLTVTVHEDADAAAMSYDGILDYSLDGCDVKDAKGSWAKGTLATGTNCYSGIESNRTVLFAVDENLTLSAMLDLTESLGSGQDCEGTLTTIGESVITASAA